MVYLNRNINNRRSEYKYLVTKLTTGSKLIKWLEPVEVRHFINYNFTRTTRHIKRKIFFSSMGDELHYHICVLKIVRKIRREC